MTIEDARGAIEYIKEVSTDDESAHSAEDKLYRDVLKEFTHLSPASDLQALRAMAELALSTSKIAFGRHCA